MIHHLDNVDKQSIIELIYSLFKSSHSLVVNGRSSYGSKYDYSKHKEFEPLVKQILSIVPDYQIYDMWFNVYQTGGYVKAHNHSSIHTENHPWLCGVYNLKKPENSGDFYLNDNKIEAQEGDFFVFTPNDIHYTTQNQSKEDRIVLSFNFRKN